MRSHPASSREATVPRVRPRLIGAALALIGLGFTVGVIPAAGQPTESGEPPVATDRIAGATRQQTALAVADRAFPQQAEVVYLAEQGSELALALTAASIGDGPVLLVPATGDVDPGVSATIRRLDPARVVVVGDDLPADRVQELADGRPTTIPQNGTDLEYAAALAVATAPTGGTVYLSEPVRLADGLAGGSLNGPVLLVDGEGPVDPAVLEAIRALDPERVVALGGTAAVADAVLDDAAQGRTAGRLAGGSRYDTAAAIAVSAYPQSTEAVYIARADIAPDAVVAGVLPGPVLLVDTCQAGGGAPPVHPATRAAVDRLQPARVVALGGQAAVCQAVLDSVADPGPQVVERAVGAHDYATDLLADPWDYSNPEDIHLDAATTIGLTAMGLADGIVSFSTTSGFVYLLWPAFPANGVPIGRDGLATPLDGDRYSRVSVRVWAAEPSPYYVADAVCPSGLAGSCQEVAAVNGNLQAGWQTVDVAPGWTGQVHGVRFGVGFGSDYKIAWARAYQPRGGSVAAAAGGSGTAIWDDDDDPGDNTADDPGWGPLPSEGLSADTYPPGDYWVHDGGVTTGPFRIAAPPQVQILDPDLAGGEDYATAMTGDPWDFEQATDIVASGNANLGPFNGVLTGSNANTTGDPFVEMRMGGDLDPNRFHRVTVTYAVTPPLDLSFEPGGGTHGRLLFGPDEPQGYSDGGPLVAYPNTATYTFDLHDPFTVEADDPVWTARTIQRIRFDPNEDPGAGRTWSISSLEIRTDDESHGVFDLAWVDTTPESLAEPTIVAWYADTDDDGVGGTLIVDGLAQAPGVNTYRWNTCGLPPGTYIPYVEARRDGITTTTVATGPLQILNDAC